MVEDDSYHYEPVIKTKIEADEQRTQAFEEKLRKELEDEIENDHDEPIFKVVVVTVTALWCGWMLAGFFRYAHKRLCQTHSRIPDSPTLSSRHDVEMFPISGSSGRSESSCDWQRPPSPRDDWKSQRSEWRSRQDSQSNERLMNTPGSCSSRSSSMWSGLSPVGFMSRLENDFSL
jgi:hypothetical protein